MTDSFDSWLEAELEAGLSARTRQVRPSSAQLMSIVGSPAVRRGSGRLTLKAAAIAIGAVVLSATAALAAGTAATGTANPLAWGQKVSHQVSVCKSQLASGQHGIGDCVSAFAKQHGQAERQQHSQAGKHGSGPTHTPGPPAGVVTGHGSGAGHSGATPAPKKSP